MAITHNHHVGGLRSRDLAKRDGQATDDRRISPARRLIGVVIDPDSYRNIAYLLMGLPLGTIWFTALVTGVVVGASMLVVALIGIPILLGMWLHDPSVRKRRARHGQRAAGPAPPIRTHGVAPPRKPVGTAPRHEPARWHEVGFLLLQFPAGIATFAAATAALSAPLWLAWAPFQARIVNDHPFGNWAGSSRLEDLTSSPWSWLLVPLGLLLLLGSFHALNGLARACGRWTTSSLTADIQARAESGGRNDELAGRASRPVAALDPPDHGPAETGTWPLRHRDRPMGKQRRYAALRPRHGQHGRHRLARPLAHPL
jgi:hypothetical protein